MPALAPAPGNFKFGEQAEIKEIVRAGKDDVRHNIPITDTQHIAPEKGANSGLAVSHKPAC